MKLLSPVGNMDSLRAAVWNGCDEVYLGIEDTNARNNIEGFTLATLQEAVDFAHVYGVFVCLAVNILFTDEELPTVVDTVVQAYNCGVDAFIVQDLGLASVLHTLYPAIVLHASTQMGLHNWEGVRAVLPFGFKRIVLARETPLQEVRRIRAHTDVELEYFVQGALCVSFSGNCYLSESLCDASGNRGRCKQLCRLPYTLQKDGKPLKKGYLLSAKDFNMIDRLPELAQAGVDVLKIEGRARRASYVAMTTAQYRLALDGMQYDRTMLALAFNRMYTAGYLDGNGDIISPYANHIGLYVGQVRTVRQGKRFNEVIISSNRSLSAKSVFKLYQNGEECATLSAFDLTPQGKGLYRITTTQNVPQGASVHLIVDAAVEDEALAVRKKRSVQVNVRLVAQEPIQATAQVDGISVCVQGATCQVAKSQPISFADVSACFAKSECYSPDLKVEAGQVFLTKQALNQCRRDLYAALTGAILAPYRRDVSVKPMPMVGAVAPFADFAYVEEPCANTAASHAVYSPAQYKLDEVRAFVDHCRSRGQRPYLDVPNFALQEDIALLRHIVQDTGIGVVANNYFALHWTEDTVAGPMLNVYNRYAAAALGVPYVPAHSGLAPYMTLRHCPFKSHLGATCAQCSYVDGYTFCMDNGTVLRLTRKRLHSCTFYLQ